MTSPLPNWNRSFVMKSRFAEFLPDGFCRTDPRDGAVVVFHAARARQAARQRRTAAAADRGRHPRSRLPRRDDPRRRRRAPERRFHVHQQEPVPVLCIRSRTPAASARQRPRGQGACTFCSGPPPTSTATGTTCRSRTGWWPSQRLAALERKLLLDEQSGYPVSGQTADGRQTRGYVLIIKNFGRLVGGSLAHGHQQIVYSSQKPPHFARNEQFEASRGEPFAAYMLRENPSELLVKDYGAAVLMVPYFMRRPYNTLLILKDTSKRHLCECNRGGAAGAGQGLGRSDRRDHGLHALHGPTDGLQHHRLQRPRRPGCTASSCPTRRKPAGWNTSACGSARMIPIAWRPTYANSWPSRETRAGGRGAWSESRSMERGAGSEEFWIIGTRLENTIHRSKNHLFWHTRFAIRS